MFTASNRDKTKPSMVDGTERTHVGWSNDGMVYYNAFYDCIEEDRTKNGNAFNKQMLLTLMEKATLKQMATKQKQQKERVIPQNDMQQMIMINMNVPDESCGTQMWEDLLDDVLSSCKSKVSV